jgi:hypothetical protein
MQPSDPADPRLKFATLYRCNAGGDHFASGQANCEGQTTEGLLGYVVVGGF